MIWDVENDAVYCCVITRQQSLPTNQDYPLPGTITNHYWYMGEHHIEQNGWTMSGTQGKWSRLIIVMGGLFIVALNCRRLYKSLFAAKSDLVRHSKLLIADETKLA